MLAYDKQIEKSDVANLQYDLTPTQKKVAQAFARTGTRKAPPAYKFTQRERKPDATKEGIIEELATFYKDSSQFAVENLSITNKSREIAFTIGDEDFTVTLIRKNKNKKK